MGSLFLYHPGGTDAITARRETQKVTHEALGARVAKKSSYMLLSGAHRRSCTHVGPVAGWRGGEEDGRGEGRHR